MVKKCPDCNIKMIEVRVALNYEGYVSRKMYPKEIVEPELKRTYNKYCFFCNKSKKGIENKTGGMHED